MTNIPVTPFYVPRPSEEQLWSKGPISNRGIVDLTTNVKFFGAGGQAPTKKWGPPYTDNVAESFWNWPPVSSYIIPQLTQKKMFGQGGQVPVKNWVPPYTFDDPSVWNIQSVSSDSIPLLTKQKMFGQGGQGVTKHWEQADLGEAHWNIQSISSKYLVAPSPFPSNNFNDYNDPLVWNGQPLDVPQTLSANPFKATIRWSLRSGSVDDPIWPTQINDVPQILTSIPFKTTSWSLRNVDDLIWSSRFVNVPKTLSVTTNPLVHDNLGLGYDVGESFWQWTISASSNLSLPTTPVWEWICQFSCTNYLDNSSIWQGAPLPASLIPNVITGGVFYTPRSVDDPYWSLTTRRDTPLNVVIAKPVIPVFYNFNFSDPAVSWQQTTQRSAALPITFLPFAAQQAWSDIADDQLWSLTKQRDLSLNTVFNYAFAAQQASFDVDDPPAWQGTPLHAISAYLPVSNVVFEGVFYAPRPADDPCWSGSPLGQNIDLLLVVYENGNQYFNYRDNDDAPPAWQGVPRAPSIYYLPVSNVIFEGVFYAPRPADVPVQLWNYDSNQCLLLATVQSSLEITGGTFYAPRSGDESYWQGAPVSYNLSLPTTPVLEWIYQFYFSNQYNDDSSIWTGKSVSDSLITQTNSKLVGGTFYIPRPGDDPYWSSKPIYSTSVRIPPSGKPFVSKFYKFNIDYSEFWKQPTQRDLSMALVPGIPPYKIRQQSFAYDDHTLWYAGSPDSTILPSSTAGGIIKAKQWHYDNDDFSSWLFPWNNYNQVNATAAKVKPFNAVYWKFNNDDTAVSWQQPVQRNAALPLVPNIKTVYWNFNSDDPPPWQQPSRRFISYPSVPNIEAIYWRFNNDDSPSWQQPSQRSIAPFSGPVIRNHWRLDPSDDQLWSFTIRWNMLVGLVSRISINSYWRLNISEDDSSQPWSMMDISQAGFILPTIPLPVVIGFNQTFIYDDPAVWSGGPVDSDIIPDMTAGGQVQSHQWLFGYDDPAFWSSSPITSKTMLPVTASGQVQSHQWLFGNDDPVVWSGSPINSNAIPALSAGGIIKAKQWHYDNNDFSTWFPWFNRNLIEISLKPFIAVFWEFNNDDSAASWQPPVQKSLSLGIFNYPAIIRQPTFDYDDYASWQWLVKNPVILSLVWNINIERIANTAIENRIIDVSVENQVVAAPIETRIVDAPDEDT